MVANLIKTLLVLFAFLVVMRNSESKSVPDVEVGSPSIRDLEEVEDRIYCATWCWYSSSCCSNRCIAFLCR